MTYPAPRILLPLLATGLCLIGCTSGATPQAARQGPGGPAYLRVDLGTYEGQPAKRVLSEHYIIETTIEDPEFVQSLGQLMEGALAQYQHLTPGLRLTDKPMLCHVFASRKEWAGYTLSNAGEDAEVYLQINRGGYTAGDRYVAYFIGDVGTWCVAAHEGWHQYVARHFRQRPPPFLEEGLACLFEDITWDGDLPRWNLTTNSTRESGLRKTIGRGVLIPLDRLCTMHAGQVVNTSPARIEGFYAQSWAFARFLWDGEGGRYRPALQKMLTELATGRAPGGMGGGSDDLENLWDPRTAKPLLEHYLGKDLDTVNREYQVYLRRLATATIPYEREH